WWSGGAASRIAHRRRCARGRPHGGHPPAAAAPERYGGARQETAGAGAVRGLRGPHPGPVPAAGVSRPGVARRLPQVRRVRAAAGRDLHVLPARRQGLLQAGLRQALRHQVRAVPGGLQQQRPGDARPRPRLPPGVLPLRRLRPPAAARGSVLPAGAGPALPRRPRAAPRRRRRPRAPQPRAAARAPRRYRHAPPAHRCRSSGRAGGLRAAVGGGADGARPPSLPPSLSPPRRAGARTAARPAAAVAQSGREDHPRADGAEREAATHAADLLRRQPETRRPDEGAAGGDDGAQPARHPRLVPEQALQGQEEVHPHEAAPAAAAQRQDEPAGPHRDAAGGRQPRPARERRAGQRGGGADLPAALEGAQRLRAAERPGAARRLPAAGLLLRVRLFGHVFRQRRDLAVLPAPRHPQQHGAQPGRDVRPPGPRRRGTSACRAPCMRHPAPRRAQRAGRAPLSFNYSYLKPN
uniref:Uncharacterized protein n=1 Tax=Pavo cristatus TaxID=9049 RepID=A0A8C9EHE9_PAVCR